MLESMKQPLGDESTTPVRLELEKSVRPLKAWDISLRLGGPQTWPVVIVNERLLKLQLCGDAKLVRGGWVTTRPKPPITGRNGAGTPLAAPDPITPLQNPGSRADKPPLKLGHRWEDFRRLCLYYADCLRIEQSSSISAYVSQENVSFAQVSMHTNWRALATGMPIAIPIKAGWDRLIMGVRNASTMGSVYIGYPSDVLYHRKDGESWTLVSPVFVHPVECHVDQHMLMVRPLSSPQINQRWLELRLRNEDARRELVEACGLEVSDVADEESDNAVPRLGGLDEMAAVLRNCYSKFWSSDSDSSHLSLSSVKPGIVGRGVLIVAKDLKYTARLLRELKKIATTKPDEDLDNSALAPLFPHESPAAVSGPGEGKMVAVQECLTPVPLIEVIPLNQSQRRACNAAISSSLTVITGPPGTGKSRVVGNLLSHVSLTGGSALLASRNHQALEAVVPQLNAMTDPHRLAIRLSSPFSSVSEDPIAHLFQELLASGGLRKQQLLESNDEVRRWAGRSADVLRQLDEVGVLAEHLRILERQLSEQLWEHPDWLNSPALSSDLPNLDAIRALVNTLTQELLPPRSFWGRLQRYFSSHRELSTLLGTSATLLNRFPASILPPFEITSPTSVVAALTACEPFSVAAGTMGQLRQAQARMELKPTLSDLHSKYSESSDKVCAASRRALTGIASSVGSSIPPEQRQRLAEIWSGIQNRGSPVSGYGWRFERALRDIMPALLRQMPVWAVTSLSAGRFLPLSAGAFDHVIIDEASQCDIASSIPLIFRARSVCVVGDPRQLSHVSRIPKDSDMALRVRHNLRDVRFERYTYRTNSLYQMASTSANCEGPYLLNDHYRCHPQIAGYCNQVFYRNELSVITEATGSKNGISWTDIEDDAKSAPGGGAWSALQVKAVIAELDRLVGDKYTGSLGVVSPFRAQANRINDAVRARFSPVVLSHLRFHCDTADGFQGDERDVIILSLVGGASLPRGAEWFLHNSPNRFNVSVSRARHVLHVVGNKSWARSCGIRHISALLDASESAKRPATMRSDLIGPVWEPKFADKLRNAAIPFEQQYPACGRYLDFAVIGERGRLNVEIDGEHHRGADGLRVVDDLHRDRVLIGAGWKVRRFWVYQLREDLPACIDEVERIWKSIV